DQRPISIGPKANGPHTALLLKYVSLPVVPTLHGSFRRRREGTKHASGRGKDTYNGSECTYKSYRIPGCIGLKPGVAALLHHAAGRTLPDKAWGAQCTAAHCQRH